MYERFTDRARKVMQLANQAAQRLNHEYIGTEHILLGLVKDGSGVGATVIMENFNIPLSNIRLAVEKLIQSGPDMITMGKLPQTPRTKKSLEYAMEEARDLFHNYVGTEHLLLGLAREDEGVAAQVLHDLGIEIKALRKAVTDYLGNPDNAEEIKKSKSTKPAKWKFPAVDTFTRDLTELAREGKLKQVIGREEEIDRLIAVLGRLDRHNAILIGSGGIGRRSIVNGLAQRIASGSVSNAVIDCRVVELDQALLVSGTKYRGQFEERVKAMVNEIRRAKNVILIVPQLHLLGRLGEFEETGLSALEVLKHGMDGSQIKCIGICSPHEYDAHLSGDSDILKLFQPIHVEPPTKEQTLDILRGLKKTYEDHHHVKIKDQAIQSAVELSDIYIVDLPFPAKAINLIDEAGAQLGSHQNAPDVSELDKQIAEMDAEKEAAVGVKKFDVAANFRDKADGLKNQKEALLLQWREENLPCGIGRCRECRSCVKSGNRDFGRGYSRSKKDSKVGRTKETL